MKGVVFRESDPVLWPRVLELSSRVRDYVGVVGLELILDEAEGYAYLRQRPPMEGEPEIPRLVPRRKLGYFVSLLVALLRKKLAENDAAGGESRLILSRQDMVDMVRIFLPDTVNEARLSDQVAGQINKVAEMGFLRKMKGDDDRFEVRRILKAFVDAQWLEEFDRRLSEYRDPPSGVSREEEA
ncbi:MAG: DUF4194 domain-containing protein [Nitrospirae bacterium]|jgi:hypothetical protein|nr:DUF4194 domain-containing protein [Nitrospirota bacterium]